MKYIKFSELFKRREKATETKIEPLTDEQEIEEIVNRLILKLKDMGYDIAFPNRNSDFGNLNISVHNLGTQHEHICVWKNTGNKPFEIKVKPHFTEF